MLDQRPLLRKKKADRGGRPGDVVILLRNTQRFSTLLFAAAVLLTLLSSARASSEVQARSRTETSGLALAAGLGHAYAGLGGQLLYVMQLPGGLWRLSPHAGGGYLPADDFGRFGWAVGVMTSWGRRHRAVVDLSYGLVAVRGLELHGAIVARDGVYGISAAAGYEYMSPGGVFVGLQAGAAVATSRIGEDESRWLPALAAGLGWKLW